MDIFALNNCNFASGVKFVYLSKLSKAWSLPSYLAINSAVAHAAYFANNKKLTISELIKIKKIDPKWQTAVLFEGYVLGSESQEKAVNFYVSYLTKIPLKDLLIQRLI